MLIYGAAIVPCLGFQFEAMMEAGEEQEEHAHGMITFKDFLKDGVSLLSLSPPSHLWLARLWEYS